jgi:hypothetical protein
VASCRLSPVDTATFLCIGPVAAEGEGKVVGSVLDDALEAVTLLQGEATPAYEGAKQESPRANSTGLIESSETAQQLKSKVKQLGVNRDKLFTEWRQMRTNCRLMRQQNRDFEEEILAEGHMILLALEMKLAVEKRPNDLAEGEVPPQNQYKEEVKKSQASQKASYQAMLTNRHTADKVCEMEAQLEGQYKVALGRYEEASVHLKWRLAHGCFHHGLAHYCVRVTKWCGKGKDSHPCQALAQMSSLEQEGKADMKNTAGRRLLAHGNAAEVEMPVPIETLTAAKTAVKEAAWPQEKSCYDKNGVRHCAIVDGWLRHPGMNREGNMHGTLPRDAFIPQSVKLLM